MEKLVKEIVAGLEDIANYSVTDEFFPSREEYLREVAQRFITRIGKAVLNRESEKVDEALGVVGRGTIKYPKTSTDLDEHSEIWDGELVIWDGPHQVPSPYRFIALRKEGTGKEEEG